MSAGIQFSQFVDPAIRCGSKQYILARGNQLLFQALPPKKWFQDSFTPAQREENRKTWHLFNQAVESHLGRRFQRISERYHVDFKEMEKKGSPLKSKHVQMVGVVAADFFTYDLKDRAKNEKLKDLSLPEIEARMNKLNPVSYTGPQLNVHKIYGGPTEFLAHFWHNPLLMDRERLTLFNSQLFASHEHAFLDRFSKATVTRELSEGMIVPAPGAGGKKEYYKVYKKIATGHGLVAYALKPLLASSSLQPILCFTPSQFAPSGEDFLETWINDGQLKLGKWGYSAAKKELMKLMQDSKFCPMGKKINVCGFSLAGAHVQRFLIDHALKVSRAIFFNDPSLDSDPVEEFANRMNALPSLSEKLYLKIYRTTGDKAHYMGEKHVGWGITHPDIIREVDEIIPLAQDGIEGSYLHSHRFFDAPQQRYSIKQYRGAEVDKQLNNQERGEEIWWYEKMRRWFPVRLVYGYICFLYWVGSSIGNRLNFHIFRNSANKKPKKVSV